MKVYYADLTAQSSGIDLLHDYKIHDLERFLSAHGLIARALAGRSGKFYLPFETCIK